MYRPEAMRGAISKAKNELVKPEAFEASTYWAEVARRVYARYQEIMAANGALDFDDLLTRTTWLFQEQPEVLKRYQERYQYLLVDEFQDTNTAQYEMVHLLVQGHRNLFGVGDEDQSIFAFRGADYRNVMRFREDFPEAKVILLEQNYRSTQTILDAANAVIAKNRFRTPKKLRTDRGSGLQVVVQEAYDESDEAAFVVRHDPAAGLAARGEAGRLRGDVPHQRPVPRAGRCLRGARACPTAWWAARASTSARRSRMRWPTCGWCTTRPTTSAWAG